MTKIESFLWVTAECQGEEIQSSAGKQRESNRLQACIPQVCCVEIDNACLVEDLIFCDTS